MIECKNCELPTFPPVLFWERLLGIRLPCLCGCAERERVATAHGPAVAQTLDLDIYAQMRADDDGMRVRVADFESQAAVQILDFEFDAEIRATDDGMPESLTKNTAEDAVIANMRQRYFAQTGDNPTQNFRRWLETQDKKSQAAAAANAEKGLVVRKTFRPLMLKEAFDSMDEEDVHLKSVPG